MKMRKNSGLKVKSNVKVGGLSGLALTNHNRNMR